MKITIFPYGSRGDTQLYLALAVGLQLNLNDAGLRVGLPAMQERAAELSMKTIGNYVSNIFSKRQVADRVQAIMRACEAGLGR